MPRNVRNFWVEGERSDGRAIKGTGPVGSLGEMSLRLYYRENGGVSGPVRINCRIVQNKLVIFVNDNLICTSEP